MDFAEIHVDQKYHRHIIGKGGASGEFIYMGSLLLFCKSRLRLHVGRKCVTDLKQIVFYFHSVLCCTAGMWCLLL